MDLREGRPLFYNDTTFADFTRLRVKKINRTTHVFLGDAITFVDFGNDYTVNHLLNILNLLIKFLKFKIEANIYQKQGNQYRKMPYNIKKAKYCDFVANDIHFYDQLLEVSDFPAKGVCPWPKGTYTIRGAYFELSNIPPYFDGDLMLEGVIRKDNVVVNGYQLFVNVVKV